MTTIGFVSTSVLESKDGIDFGDEKRLETEEVKEAEQRALEAARRPLWEQLQEREESKAEKFEAVRKAIFAPPKGLDDEDVDFLETVEQRRRAAQEKEKSREVQEIEAFASARANQVLASRDAPKVVKTVVAPPKAEDKKSEAGPAAPIIKKRRKEEGHHKKKSKKVKTGGLGGLVGYGSDASDP